MGYVEFWRGCVEYWRGLHIDLHPAIAGGQGGNWLVATLATQWCLLRTARQAGWDGASGGEAGQPGRGLGSAWWDGWPDGGARRVGGWPGGGWPGGPKGMDLQNKECSGVNVVT